MYRERLAPEQWAAASSRFDIFLSALNDSERVRSVFANAESSDRYWIVHDEYGYDSSELSPPDQHINPGHVGEEHFARSVFSAVSDLDAARLCIDITGFMRSTLLCVIRHLVSEIGRNFWLLYSEPSRYGRDEHTTFSKSVDSVSLIEGYRGVHDPMDVTRDHLVLGTGYDGTAMRAVINDRWQATRIDVLGLPSLQPSMYQENVLSVSQISEGRRRSEGLDSFFAPANDPFGTAEALHRLVHRLRLLDEGNLYLSPTGTKPQVVGFGLFYLAECRGSAASIILPRPVRYAQETSEGHSRSWLYEIDAEFIRSRW